MTYIKPPPCPNGTLHREFAIGALIMMDAAMLAIGFVFFALSIAYVYACDLL